LRPIQSPRGDPEDCLAEKVNQMLTVKIELEGRLALLPVRSNAVTEQSRGIYESSHPHPWRTWGLTELVPGELPWQIVGRGANSYWTGIDVDTT